MKNLLGLTCPGVALVAALVAGCGGDGAPMQAVVKTSGTVTLDGKPAEGVDVRFIPKDKANFKLDESPLGRTDAAGKFTLSTYYAGDGAPPGEYMVAVSYTGQEPDGQEGDETEKLVAANKAAKDAKKSGKPRFPSVYQVPQKSGLTATVTEGGGELPALELTTPK